MNFRSLFIFILICSQTSFWATAQRRVIFPSKDGLSITADLYETNPEDPFIVLLHMARSSRGEYREIAKRLNKLELNCMVPDLRSGRESNFISNETNVLATKLGLKTRYLDSEPDILTAIDNAFAISGKPIILMGSSYSASMALTIAKNNPKVKAVIAFSPGEYFGKALNVEETLAGLRKPAFVSCSAKEREHTKQLISGVASNKLVFFAPATGGVHGSESLNPECAENTIYWIQLINFIQNVKKEYY